MREKKNVRRSLRTIVGEPLYQELRRLIASSEPGTLLASERKLALEFAISLGTVRRVMQKLVEDGLIRKVHGKGNIVAEAVAPRDYGRGTIVLAEPVLDPSHPFWGPRLQGVIETSQDLRYNLQIVCIRSDHHEERAQLLGTVCRPEVIGFIYPFGSHSFLPQVWAARPDMAVVSEHPCQPGTLSAAIMLDMFSFGTNGLNTLARAGSRKPLAITINPATYYGALAAAGGHPGLDLQWLPIGNCNFTEIAGKLKKLKFDGLLFDDDIKAAAVLTELPAGKRGLPAVSTANPRSEKLPENVRRFIFDGYETGRLLIVTLDNLIRERFFAGTRIMIQAQPSPSQPAINQL